MISVTQRVIKIYSRFEYISEAYNILLIKITNKDNYFKVSLEYVKYL